MTAEAELRASSLVAVVAAALLGSPSAAGPPGRGGGEELEPHRDLETLLREPTPLDVLETHLRALGPGVYPAALDVLVRRPAWLEPAEEQAVVRHVAAGGAVMRGFLDSTIGAAASAAERGVALRILGEGGDASDLGRLARFAAPPPRTPHVEREVARTFADALTRILERSDGLPRGLRAFFCEAHPSLLAAVVRATADAGSPDARQHLASFLGARPAADPLLLVELGRLGERLGPPLPASGLEAVRAALNDPEPRVARLAIRTVARLGDQEAVGKLLELWELEETRADADHALRRLTGHDGGQGGWTRYLADEAAWWREEGRARLEELRSPAPGVVLAALRELVRHPLYRGKVGRELVPLLDRPEPELVRGAAAAAGVLRWQGAVEPLVRRLRRAETPEVERSVREALSRIVGGVGRP